MSNGMESETGFGQFLRSARMRARLSAADLAEASGLNQTQISNWEAGKNQPSVPNLRRLAPVLHVSLLRLMVEAGHLTRSEAQMKDTGPAEPPRPVTIEEVVEGDPALIDEAKRHLLSQYELLSRLSAASGSKEDTRPLTPATTQRSLRAVARRRPRADRG